MLGCLKILRQFLVKILQQNLVKFKLDIVFKVISLTTESSSIYKIFKEVDLAFLS